ncbi:protein HIRA isoform X2 [Ischnura elegans]|uniref:protein HIRA isoform X2 n=1 Tax=Ischnura elegans TaxID=197161 RepID=UPI001ED86B9E|nr:protein HIRA isoform X2 [Ischnura elegans]
MIDLPIFSVDIHPDGSRFATGGQGEDSGRVVIWNMAPVVSHKSEMDENVPKMLCQIDNHLACVNCVRWSVSGKFLASGGDDKLVMVWKIGSYSSGSTVFGGGGKVNVESWRCVSTLRGHAGDVLDLAWSPHDAWLATCSVDNTVIIWNAVNMSEMVAVLKGHSGMVKGLAWDPVGKFVASQSDDKTLRIWRTLDWKEDTVISEPFEECGGTTHVLRLSWSPDGQYLVSAHAMNGGGPTAQIVEREGWRQDKDFVGHRKAVTCVRFNSNILQKFNKTTKKDQQCCCCAIGSRDRSLSVWLTALKRPLVVIRELFTSSVLDLSWSVAGLQLMACSWDGTVAYVEFSDEELGVPLTAEEKMTLHERMYGKSLAMYWQGGVGGAAAPTMTIVENPELLAVKEEADKKAANDVAAAATTTGPSESGSERPTQAIQQVPPKGPINKQIETRTSDGKRRITPMYIPDTGDQPQPYGSSNSQQPTFSSSSEPKSRIVIEKRDDVIVQPNVSNSSQHSSNTCMNILSTNATATSQSGGNSRGMTVAGTVGEDGTSVAQTTPTKSVVVNGAHEGGVGEAKTPGSEEYSKPQPTPESAAAKQDRPSTALVFSSVESEKPVNRLAVKRKATDSQDRTPVTSQSGVAPTTTPAPKPPAKRGRPPLSDRAPASQANSSPSQSQPSASGKKGEVDGKDVVSAPRGPLRTSLPSHHLPGMGSRTQQHQPPAAPEGGIFLSPMRLEKGTMLQVAGTNRYLELENGIGAHAVRFKERTADGYKVLWEMALGGSRVAGASVGPKVAAVAMEDGVMHVFECGSGSSLSGVGGCRPFPPVVLPAPAARLSISGSFLMAVSTTGGVSVWDTSKNKVVISNVSMMPIMRADSGQKVTILSCTLMQNGCPVVSLSTRKAFMYSVDLGSWLMLGNAGDPIQQSSSHLTYVRSVERDSASLPLHSVQSHIRGSSLQSGRAVQCLPASALSSSSTGPSTCILSFMELQLTSCKALQSAAEYRLWLLAMARFLVQEGIEWKLRLICDELMGPAHKHAGFSKSWESHILGISKHSLLKEILTVMGSNLKLQRLYTEYSDQMEVISEGSLAFRKQSSGNKKEICQDANGDV